MSLSRISSPSISVPVVTFHSDGPEELLNMNALTYRKKSKNKYAKCQALNICNFKIMPSTQFNYQAEDIHEEKFDTRSKDQEGKEKVCIWAKWPFKPMLILFLVSVAWSNKRYFYLPWMLVQSMVTPTLHSPTLWINFICLGGERHSECKVFCPRTYHDVPHLDCLI